MKWLRCEYCGMPFPNITRQKQRFCCWECYSLSRNDTWLSNHTLITCEHCSTQKVKRNDHIVKHGWGKFCSKNCMLKNIHWSEESKRAWGEKQKGKKLTELHKLHTSISMKLYIHTPEHNKNVSEAKIGIPRPDMIGENHWNWLGGKSDYPVEFSIHLRRQIRRESNGCCFECGMTPKEQGWEMNVHHIDYDKNNNNPENLVALCDSCHSITNYNREFWEWYYSNYARIVRENR